jgi:ABC-2 type transport system permease protein
VNWSQLGTVLWLRWRLSRNQWTRGGSVNAVVAVIIVIAGLGFAVAGGVAGVIGGAVGLAQGSPSVLLLVWDGIVGVFLFVWMLGLVAEIQRSETIDLGRLLHLPVSLKHIFLVNYVASHLTLSLVLFLPGMLGLCAGLTWSKGWSMILLYPLALSFVFMVTAWTYCLRGWLIALMVNQRRRRAVIAGVTMAAVLLSQLPNLYFNVVGQRGRGQPRVNQSVRPADVSSAPQSPDGKPALPPAFLTAHEYIPPMWVGNGAMALATGNAWPAIGGSLGAFVIGALGLMRAYRSTVRFYQGGQTRKVARPPPATRAAETGRRQFLERELPGVPEEAAALALAFFRSLVRAPEVKMMLAGNVIMPLVFAAVFFSRGMGTPGDKVRPFLATGAVAFTFLSMVQLMFNQFGFDREGFRALVLLPAHRRHILLAKNLSLLPIGCGMGLIFLALVAAALRVPLLAVLAAGCHLASTFLLLSIVGNFVSVVAPYRIAAGSLKPTKAPAKTMALIFVSHLMFPIAMAPIFIPPALGLLSESLSWLPAGPVNLLLSLLWLAVVVFLYRMSLKSFGNLLQRREQAILQAVTQEVE